ncbi:MAG: hypothetical protein F6K08_23910 [Okeania sp. SIO1H6]|uniref:Uncharacterized protein n=1 Tax=Okeania hirsuta TaxID=1458930 RepID=A0A3N6NCQ0_9CYAN|nr:hypothetical protein [Okeania sp. SIO1H6]RQH14328.1 hypothetical protein D4Z78_23070 [Okeania hirsuta]RQH40881.1 hypothetical protein D5R40_15790 [Okeania hirsuta]
MGKYFSHYWEVAIGNIIGVGWVSFLNPTTDTYTIKQTTSVSLFSIRLMLGFTTVQPKLQSTFNIIRKLVDSFFWKYYLKAKLKVLFL